MGFLDSVFGTIQSGWNLFKDITGLDYERQKDVSEDLQANQAYHDNLLAEQQQARNLAMLSQSQDFYQQNMQLQHGLNQQSMEKQFELNSRLSNAARNIIQQRLAGVNPDGGSGAVSSVTALGASGGVPASPGTSSPSVGSATVGIPRFSGADAASVARSYAETQEIKSRTNLNKIEARTKLERQLADLSVKRSEYIKNMSNSHYFDVESDSIVRQLDWQIGELRSRIKYNDAAAEHEAAGAIKDIQLGAAAVSEANEQIRHNKAIEALQQIGLNIEADKADAIIANYDALAREHNLTADKLEELKPYWIDAYITEIGLKEALKEKAVAEAKLTGKDVDWYEEKLGLKVLKGLADTATDIAPTKNVGKGSKIDRSKMKRKQVVNGVTPQGRKRVDTYEWYE